VVARAPAAKRALRAVRNGRPVGAPDVPLMSDGRPILLVLRALGLGDLLTAVPVLRALATAFPGYRRVLATRRALAPLALHADLADEVLPTSPLADLAWSTYRPTLAVDLQGRGPDSQRLLLATHPARLIAFAHPLVAESWTGPLWLPDEHEVRRWCRLAVASGVAADPSDLTLDLPPRPIPAEAVGATIVHPGGRNGARRWPAERWAVVVAAERAAGRTVLLTGDRSERGLACAIARRAGLPLRDVWAGRTDLLMLAALVRRAARVACGDTGIAHLATACGTPSVVLFGPTSPAECGPPAHRPWHRVLWYGRRGNPQGSSPDPGLLAITCDDVVRALADLPPAPRAAPRIDPPRRPTTALRAAPRVIPVAGRNHKAWP
jgi:ADP-heptose:LPS heptosyltransferase